MFNIDYPKLGGNVREAAEQLFALIQQNKLPDPSLAFGEGMMQEGKGGQSYEFTKYRSRSVPFYVRGRVNLDTKGNWATSSGGSEGGARENSHVEIFGGYVNGKPIKIEGVDLSTRPYKKDIDAWFFQQNGPIGVALHAVTDKEKVLSNSQPTFSIKFHLVQRFRAAKARRSEAFTAEYFKRLWKGCRISGRGTLTGSGDSAFKGESEGAVLLAVIIPPPEPTFVQIVTKNLNWGIFNTIYNNHKHCWWG